MRPSKLGLIVAGSYLTLAALSIGYELSIRLFDRGNSEFAGMLSTVLTLPTVLAAISIANRVFGVRVGDSDTSFVVILGLAARQCRGSFCDRQTAQEDVVSGFSRAVTVHKKENC